MHRPTGGAIETIRHSSSRAVCRHVRDGEADLWLLWGGRSVPQPAALCRGLSPAVSLADGWLEQAAVSTEVGGEGRKTSERPPSGWTRAYRPETHCPTRTPQAVKTQHTALHPLLQAVYYLKVRVEPRLQREFSLVQRRFSVNSAFYHHYGTVPAMLFRVVW